MKARLQPAERLGEGVLEEMACETDRLQSTEAGLPGGEEEALPLGMGLGATVWQTRASGMLGARLGPVLIWGEPATVLCDSYVARGESL